MSEAIAKLMLANLLEVFNERDDLRRSATIDRTYADDVRWTDADGVTAGRAALSAKCVELQRNLGDARFEPNGMVHALPGFGLLEWRLVDPATDQPVMAGLDVAVITDGRIGDLWTVLIGAGAETQPLK